MNHSTLRHGGLLALVVVAACSGSHGSNTPATDSSSCASNQLPILFTPMFTAYDGTHMFKIPAVVDNIDPSAVKWTASDPSMVDITSDSSAGGGVMISPRKAGTVQIIASAGAMCGTSLLTITAASPEDWALGNTRYNNGVPLTGTLAGRGNPDAGVMKDVACTNCHGVTATMGQFNTVSHTPEQTGGFSDDELIAIFTKGVVPINGYFDTSVVPYNQWHIFHTWEMSPQDAKGVVVYLRSLVPETQEGKRGAFGRRPRDGGVVGAMPGPPAASPDAGSSTD
jgi:hypothetical protein